MKNYRYVWIVCANNLGCGFKVLGKYWSLSQANMYKDRLQQEYGACDIYKQRLYF